MKQLLVLLGLIVSGLVSAQTPYPYDTRSDSIAITHYDIRLDLRDFTTFILYGHTSVNFEPIVNNIQEIRLDLMGLTVDSVQDINGNNLTFTTHTNGFTVDLGATYNTGDATGIQVYYHGNPVEDAVFGGFYFNSTYAYNVGVSLNDIPHNYGKTWFPCFDNFITRSTYDLYVTTNANHDASCGGVHIGTIVNPDLSETHHWKINQTIPTYLASVAVANYVFVNDTFTDYQNNPVPVALAALASDTTDLNNSFVNLEEAFDIYENTWGPYHWDRVGYVLVPMTSGAMEHAMNIAYPLIGADGSLTWQSVMAHELSHHWWGNLVTCRTAEDMWINEGSAVYCEYVFLEQSNSRTAYENKVRTEHKDLLRTCHHEDGGYWPLSGIPQDHTYGNTTYLKGADILHTLRAYLGDSLFFNGLRQLLDQNQFSDIDAIEYRDELSAITGVNLNNFFNDWIFQEGWPHIAIDSLTVTPAGADYTVEVHLRQKLAGRTNYSTQVPVTLTLRDDNWNTWEGVVQSSGQTNTVSLTVPFAPSLGYLNKDELISHAVTASYKTVTATGNTTLSHANFTLQVQTVGTDSSFVVVEHNWVAPDPVIDWSTAYIISPQRYWRVDGIWENGFSANATLRYSGQTSGSNAWLDDQLITGAEDSIILLYRPNCSVDWTEFPTYTKSMGNVTDKIGTVNVTNLLKGEYAFALQGPNAGLATQTTDKAVIYPNPANGQITISSTLPADKLIVTDMEGRLIKQKHTSGTKHEWNTDQLAAGTYVISAYLQSSLQYKQTLIVR